MEKKYKGANICLVSQGPTAERNFSEYHDEEYPDEPWHIWTQNGGWMTHTYSSLGFMMDDFGSDIWQNVKKWPHDGIQKTVQESRMPIVTARAYPEFPALIEFPLQRAMDELPIVNDSLNLNETITYMVALGIMFGVKRMDFWGADYYSPDGKSIRADKRACCEYWIGVAVGRGMTIRTYSESDLMRSNLHRPTVEIEGVYGYEQDNLPPEIASQLEIDGTGRARIKVGGNGAG